MTAWTLAGREIRAYFDLPIAYVVVPGFLLITGGWFFFLNPFFLANQASMRAFFEFSPFLLTLLAPAITMRLFAEERRAGTLELLLTWPVGDGAIVLGKFLGAIALLAIALVFTLACPLTLSRLGAPDLGPVVGGYVGLLLLGGAYLAIGLLVSAWTTSQIVAFMGAFLACFALYIIGRALPLVPEAWLPLVEAVSFERRFASLARGVLDVRDVVFFLSVIAAALALAAETLRARRWR